MVYRHPTAHITVLTRVEWKVIAGFYSAFLAGGVVKQFGDLPVQTHLVQLPGNCGHWPPHLWSK